MKITIKNIAEDLLLTGFSNNGLHGISNPIYQLSDIQQDWLSKFETDNVIHLDGDRQTGKSSVGLALSTATSVLNPYQCIIIVSNNQRMAEHHMVQVLSYLEIFRTQYDLKPFITRKNKSQIELENGSKIIFSGTNENTFRGRTCSLVFLDVYDRVDDNFMMCVYPSICASKGKLIISGY